MFTQYRLYRLLVATGVMILVVVIGLAISSIQVRANQYQQAANPTDLVAQGQQIFRFDTFGDEAFWGDQLRLHQAIEGSNFTGGVGPGLSPANALSLGLKVDVEALPQSLQTALQAGQVDLNDPANTLALIKLNSVVGVTGFFNTDGSLKSVGIQCALCHSTVDNSFAAGIGRRLDGWANRDLDIGAIINLAPNLDPFATVLGVPVDTVKTVLTSWGPGKFDAELILDGQNHPTLIPPAFGLAGVNMHTWTGFGSIPYWNAFVAVLEMHGQGNFFDPRLNDAARFPVATANRFFDVRSPGPDLVTPKLAALHAYQLSLVAPDPPAGSFNASAAAAGQIIFNGKGTCASCHQPPLFTEPGWNMHSPAEIGIDAIQANRSPEMAYRTAPLKGLWTHTKGGFYHDGRFATLLDVVNHYDTTFTLGLTSTEKANLVEYLMSLGGSSTGLPSIPVFLPIITR